MSGTNAQLETAVIEALKTVYDPELPVNLYDLGLIYELSVSDAGKAQVQMTLTNPACPVAGTLPGEIEAKIKTVPGITDAQVELVWEPAWTRDRMSDAARLQLNLF